MAENALSLLSAIEWIPDSSPLLTAPLLDWLMEVDSMTRRFERHCQRVTGICYVRVVSPEEIAQEVIMLPAESRYWLREIELVPTGCRGWWRGRWCRSRR